GRPPHARQHHRLCARHPVGGLRLGRQGGVVLPVGGARRVRARRSLRPAPPAAHREDDRRPRSFSRRPGAAQPPRGDGDRRPPPLAGRARMNFQRLGKKLTSGAAVAVAEQLTYTGSQFLLNFSLARLVSGTDYGRYALNGSFVTLASILHFCFVYEAALV